MPKRYEAMKQKFMAEGLSKDAAQTKAAKIENSLRRKADQPPMRAHGKGGRRGH